MKIANRNARAYVQDRVEFDGSNLYARCRKSLTDTELYVVFSYGPHFPMYIKEAGCDNWYENVDTYSITTSKQKSQARPHGVPILGMTTEAMQRIATHGIAGLAAMGEVE